MSVIPQTPRASVPYKVSIDLFEHFDFSPAKVKTLQGNDKTLPYLINYLEFNEIPLTGAHPGFVVKGGVSMREIWGLERVLLFHAVFLVFCLITLCFLDI
jgi:hypothetical protein